MPELVSNAFQRFQNRHHLTPPPSPLPLTSTKNQYAEGGDRPETLQGEQGPIGQTTAIKLSARERLDGLSKLRTDPGAISFTSSGARKGGGKAEVIQATFKRRMWNRKEKVAVKKLRFHRDLDSHLFANSFVHEVEMLAGLSHDNIVRLLAFVEDLENGTAWIVLSWEPNGNISEFLAAGKREVPERISLIQDTFEGLRYLHTRQPPICHGDLKSLNILVSASHRAIITDFGSARVVRESGDEVTRERSDPGANRDSASEGINVVATGNQLTLTGPAWSLRWAPPEVVNGNPSGLPSDIWSAGWVCWEIMTNKLPFSELDSGTAITLRLIEGKVPSAGEDEHLSQIVMLCSLMTDCWAFNPLERPTISRCCDEVKWVPSIAPLGGEPLDSKVVANRLALQMGRTHYLHARYTPADSLFQQVLKSATRGKDRKERSEALYWLGTLSAAQSKYPAAEDFYTQAYSVYALIGDDMGRANTLRGLGDIYRLQSKVSIAEEAFTRAQEIYNALGDDQGRASTLCGLGHIYCVLTEYQRAKETFRQSQEIYALIGDGQGRANTLQGLGSVYHLQAKLIQAEEAFSEAQNICARIGDDNGQAQALVSLGGLHCDRFQYAEAESTYTQALEIHSRIGNQWGQADALYGLGKVYLGQSRCTEAATTFRSANSIYARSSNAEGQANTLHGLGEAFRNLSKYDQASSSYIAAQQIYSRIGHEQRAADAFCGAGEVYRHQSKYDQATSSYFKARAIYTRIGHDEGRATAFCGLGDVYRDQSQHEAARRFYSEAQEIYTRIGGYIGKRRDLGLAQLETGQEDSVESPQSENRGLGPRTSSPEPHRDEPQTASEGGSDASHQHQDSGATSPPRRGSTSHWPLPDPVKLFGLRRTQSMPQVRSRKNSQQSTQDPRGKDEGVQANTVQRWSVLKQRLASSTARGISPLKGNRRSLVIQPSKVAQFNANEELLVGSITPLILRMWFERDENGRRRMPVLLQHLKIRISDSVHPLNETRAVFRIECEYGDGAARWVIYRELRDFVSLHTHYRISSIAYRGFQIPEFPRAGIPLFNILKKEPREKLNFAGRAELALQQREALENSLISLIKAVMFHPEANRLCRWLEISALSLALAPRGGIQGKAGFLRVVSSNPSRKGPQTVKFPPWKRSETQTWWLVRESYLVSVTDPSELIITDVFMFDADMVIERPKRVYRQGLNIGNADVKPVKSSPDSKCQYRSASLQEASVDSVPVTYPHASRWSKRFDRRSSDTADSVSLRNSSPPSSSNDTDPSIGQDPRAVDPKEEEQAGGIGGADSNKKQEADISLHTFYIRNGQRNLKLGAKNEREMLQFVASMEGMMARSPWTALNRFGSFAPIRLNVSAQWLADGRDYFCNLSRAIMSAKERIYIHDWWLSPEFYLRRPGQEHYRLDRLLRRKAEQGVKIYVILYKEVSIRTTPIESDYAKRKLMALHPNIMVQRSPAHLSTETFFWAHHEKMCVIDETIAFMGGLDLCFGRWDTPEHILMDDRATEGLDRSTQIWLGKDYSSAHPLNKPSAEIYSRAKFAGIPWHDVGIKFIGQPARDLCRHFVQRWNFLLQTKTPSRATPFLIPAPDFKVTELNDQELTGSCEVQICRSAGPWSLGTANRVEQSIHNAYIKAIALSEHFVYIENQFFITSTVVGDVQIENNIGDALVHRIIRAHREQAPWRACILIPLLPGYTFPIDHNDASSIRLMVELQNRSICRGPHSIFSRLRKEGIDPDDYITFFSLRGWGKLENQILTTEQVYIHAKIMIVDDRVAIIGSANINERSMRGDRDSELAVVVRDTDLIPGKMAGKSFKVGRFAHTLRIRLMREHVGIDTDAMYEEDLMATHAKEKPEDVKTWDPDHEQVRGKAEGITTIKHRGTMEVSEVLARDVGEQVLMGISEATAKFVGKQTKQGLSDAMILTSRHKDEEKKVHGSDGSQQPGLASSKVPTLEEKVVAEHLPQNREEGRDRPLMDAIDEGQDEMGKDAVSEARVQDGGHLFGAPADAAPSAKDDSRPPNARPGQDESSSTERSSVTARQHLRKHLAVKTGARPYTLPTPEPEIDPHGFSDPLDPRFWKDVWCATAFHNTEVYRKVFRCTPDDRVTTWTMYKEYLLFQKRLNKPPKDTPPTAPRVGRVPSEGGTAGEEAGGPPNTHPGGQRSRSPTNDGESTSHLNPPPPAGSQRRSAEPGIVPDGRPRRPTNVDEPLEQWERDEFEALLEGVKGHLVVFPTRFLEGEHTANNFLFNSDRLLPMPIFN